MASQHGDEAQGNASAAPITPENNYFPPITELTPQAEELLDKYVHLPKEEMLPHVHAMRDKAWKICPYGCIGRFSFPNPSIQTHGLYKDILSRAQKGDKVLDLGCGLGQNMRKLALDGAPAGTVYGADVSQDLISCGYEYFRDGGGAPKFMFFTGDILNLEDPVFATVEGQFNIIWTALVYHLWDYKTQLTASIATVKLLKPVPGSVLVGWQLGATPAVEVERNLTEDRKDHRTMYRHDEKSFERLWGEVGEATGTRWNVKAKNWGWPSGKPKWDNDVAVNGSRGDIISFTVTRL